LKDDGNVSFSPFFSVYLSVSLLSRLIFQWIQHGMPVITRLPPSYEEIDREEKKKIIFALLNGRKENIARL